jgi:hypothetical protein
MISKSTENPGRRLVVALAALAVVAVLAAAFRVNTQTSFSSGSGPAGSAAYRQEVAFVSCLRGHGMPGLTDPAPGGSVSVPLTQNGSAGKSSDPTSRAVDDCRRLVPGGRETWTIQITP